MTVQARFLMTLARALAAMSLYRDGHPARSRAIDQAYAGLRELQSVARTPLFTFLGDEVVFGQEPVEELTGWEWSQRLSAAGVQRLEFQQDVNRDDFEEFLEEVLARVTLSVIQSSEARHLHQSGIRFGTVGVRGESRADTSALPTATLSNSLREEAAAVRWMHDEVQQKRAVPLVEAEAVVRSLSVAMHGDRKLILPLLRLRDFDEYTTTHSLNVAVLTMALAEFLGLRADEVRAFGIAGLLHDVGKVNVPKDILTKPGKLTDQERAIMNRHPADGARIIMEGYENLDMAAVVAYEHHIMIDGGGYPSFRFRRDCHAASKLVHVCDVYDALRTHRPYREAWEAQRVLDYVNERTGTEFDTHYARSFIQMMERWEERPGTIGNGSQGATT